MEKDGTGTEGISETELVGLLASMKVHPAPEVDFESRFLYDLRERLTRESVCCPARRLLWDHLLQMLANFGPRKLAYGASTLGLGALTAGFFVMPEDEPVACAAAAATSPLTRLECSLASLRTHAGHDAAACTTIRIGGQKKTPYTEATLASGAFSTTFDRSATAASDAAYPVNMGFDALQPGSLPAYSTQGGF